jgi:hypothetical protein
VFWPVFYFLVHALMLVVDVAWWVVAFRLTKNRFWRTVISVFMSIQIVCLVTLHGPLSWVAYSPKPFLVGVVVWHNIDMSANGFTALSRKARMSNQFLRRLPLRLRIRLPGASSSVPVPPRRLL